MDFKAWLDADPGFAFWVIFILGLSFSGPFGDYFFKLFSRVFKPNPSDFCS